MGFHCPVLRGNVENIFWLGECPPELKCIGSVCGLQRYINNAYEEGRRAGAAEVERALISERNARDAAYTERNAVVAVLARMALDRGWRAWLGQHEPAEGWDPEWLTVVFVEIAGKQCSWHVHKNDASLFAFLPQTGEPWDGHDTYGKYYNLGRFARGEGAGGG